MVGHLDTSSMKIWGIDLRVIVTSGPYSHTVVGCMVEDVGDSGYAQAAMMYRVHPMPPQWG